MSIAGHKVDITLMYDEHLPSDSCLELATALWHKVIANISTARQFGADDLVPTWNEDWRRWPSRRMTADRMMKRMKLELVEIALAPSTVDGFVSYWFSDGDIFGGHVIEVSLNMEFGLQSVNLQG